MYTDDPIADFDRHDAEQTRQLNRLPECAECGQKIQDEICYEINGELICPDCLEMYFKRWTEDFIDE
jgi:formylmethanofuran dehydrogenase subunit E